MTGARASIHTGSVNESIVDIGCVAGSEGGGNSENRQIATVRALPQQTHMGAKCCTEANDTVGNTRAEPKSDNCVSLSPNKPIPDLVERRKKRKRIIPSAACVWTERNENEGAERENSEPSERQIG